MSEDDNPSALLTPRQREILRGEADISDRGMRAARARIRERIRAGVLDATLILGSEEFPTKDIQESLKIREVPNERGDPGDLVIENGVSNVIGLLYLANIDKEELVYAEKGEVASQDKGVPLPSSDWIRQLHEGWYFERRAEKGIRTALNRLGTGVKHANVSLEIERGEEFDELSELDAEDLAEYSETELLQARLEDEITNEQFMGAMDVKGRTIDGEE